MCEPRRLSRTCVSRVVSRGHVCAASSLEDMCAPRRHSRTCVSRVVSRGNWKLTVAHFRYSVISSVTPQNPEPCRHLASVPNLDQFIYVYSKKIKSKPP